MFNFRVLFFTNLTGILWLISSIFLFLKGYAYLWTATNLAIFSFFMVLSFILGTLKSRYVLSKSVRQIVTRIQSPIPFYQIYGVRFYSLIGAMIAMGVCMNLLSLHPLIRGFIDLSISFALLQGSFQYFKFAISHLKGIYL